MMSSWPRRPDLFVDGGATRHSVPGPLVSRPARRHPSCSEGLYHGLNLLHLSRPAADGFNADNVAVAWRVGRDRPLRKLPFAAGAWPTPQSLARRRSGRFTDDLFFILRAPNGSAASATIPAGLPESSQEITWVFSRNGRIPSNIVTSGFARASAKRTYILARATTVRRGCSATRGAAAQ